MILQVQKVTPFFEKKCFSTCKNSYIFVK